MSVAIVFETHALTEDNERGIATGWLPGRLSERGRVDAAAMGRRRRGDDIAAVFTSDSRRSYGSDNLPGLPPARILNLTATSSTHTRRTSAQHHQHVGPAYGDRPLTRHTTSAQSPGAVLPRQATC